MQLRTQPPTNTVQSQTHHSFFGWGPNHRWFLGQPAVEILWAFQEQRDLLELEQLQKEEMQKKLQDLEERSLDATEAAEISS